jgi:hypothetical protein
MKHQWHIRRQFKAYLDGQQRWDRAYPHLLQWGTSAPTIPNTPSATLEKLQEVHHENCSVRTGIDQSSDSDPNN